MQCLRISNGYFKRLWQDDVEAPSELKKLELFGTFVEEYPDFLGILPHVEKKVENEVEKQLSNVQHKSKLKSMIVKTCRRLSVSVPTTSARESFSFKVPLNDGTKSTTVKTPLSFLEDLVITEEENIGKIVIDGNYCPRLQSLELTSIKKLIEVQLTRLETLHCLKFSKCDHLKSLSATSSLTELEELILSECPMLEEPNLGHLNCLKKIRIESCNVGVPGIFNFKMLRELNINRCPNLHVLCLAHLSCLEKIIVNKCDHLKSVTGLSHLLELVEVSISQCGMLELDLLLEGLNRLKRIKVDRLVKVKCFELIGCKNLETVSGISFEMIRVVNISACPELKIFPVICGQRCLELIAIDGCGKLNSLTLTGCGILNRVSGNFDLNGLSISDCPMLEELPSFGRLNYLEEICIIQCGSLQNITLPSTLKRLKLNSCRKLKTVVGISRLKKLAELNVKRCPKLPLELNLSSLNQLKRITIVECWSVYNMTLPTTLIGLTVQRCMKLQFKEGIGHLTKLTELHISECPVIEEMPVVCGLSCLKRITIDGWSKFSILKVADCAILKAVRGNLDMGHLAQLWISDCPELEELPCFARLTCLVEICIFRCSKLHKVTLPRTLKNLQLESCKELKSVSEISCLMNLEKLIICECGQLELEMHLKAIDSLQSITFDGCGKLNSFVLRNCQNLKRVVGNFDVEWISIYGCHELEELSICDCYGPSCLTEINIESCNKLENITLPVKLTNFIVQRCRHLQRITGMDDLTELCISECEELDVLPIFARLSCLIRITLESCQKLKNMILPTAFNELSLHRCKRLQIVEGLGNLTKLTEMYLSECPELEVLPSLARPSCLIRIKIDSCQKLQNIILPTTLKELSVHRCRSLQIVGGLGNLTMLAEMYLSECPEIEELPILATLSCLITIQIFSCKKLHTITLPSTIKNLMVQSCEKLQKLAALGYLSKLIELHISNCPNLGELPVLFGLSSLKSITIDGCGRLNRLNLVDYEISKGVLCSFDLGHLAQLWISDCPKLEDLPSFACLTCLQGISIFRCMKLQKITLPLTVKNLHLDSCKELKNVSEISSLTNLVELIISQCGQLEFELRLEDMDSLQTIASDGCGKIKSSQLNNHQNLKRVSGNFDVEWISICGCDELEELSIHDCAGLNCLEKIKIESCDKLRNITLPAKLTNVIVQRCRRLQRIVGMGDLSKLTELHISKCPDLEDLPICFDLSSLESFRIDGCGKFSHLKLADYGMSEGVPCSFDLGHLVQLWVSDCPALEELACFAHLTCLERITIIRSTKLQKIKLPITLKNLHLDSCKELRQVSKMGSLSELTELYISECPLIEELPILGGQSCLERITINSCEKLHKITLPTTLGKLSVQCCRKLQAVAGMGDLAKLTEMCIGQCPELEELLDLAGLSCLESIKIDSRERLHNVTLPNTLIRLIVQRCREFPVLGRLSCLKSIVIESCEMLQNIQGIEELQVLETIQFLYCSNAVIQSCIYKLKHMLSNFIQVVGRAAKGAKSILNPDLLFHPVYQCIHYSDLWNPRSDIIILCALVEVDVNSSAPFHTINESYEDSTWKLNLPQGEFIITTIVTRQNYEQWEYEFPSMGGLIKTCFKWSLRERTVATTYLHGHPVNITH